jgi:hypothetical protein
VRRGGSWDADVENLRVAYRGGGVGPWLAYAGIGFRACTASVR